MKQSFEEFFDPYNLDHLAAYKHLIETSTWPEGFVPDYELTPYLWLNEINAKMAKALVELGMNGHILGMPPAD